MLPYKYICSIVSRKLITRNQSTLSQIQPLIQNTLSNKEIIRYPDGWDQAKPFSELPGPKPLPILGNVWRFFPGIGEYHGKNTDEIFTSLREVYGDILQFGGLPGVPSNILCFNPTDIETIFRNDGRIPERRAGRCTGHYFNKYRKPITSLVSLRGEEWLNRRSNINKIVMIPKVMEMYIPKICETTDILIDHIRYFLKNNSKQEMPDNFQYEIYKWTMEVAAILAYNKRIGILAINPDPIAAEYINNLQVYFDLFYKLDFHPSLWKYYETRNWKRFAKVFTALINTNQSYLKKSLSTFSSDPNTPEHEKSVFERLYIQSPLSAETMASSLLIAGVDTTGNAMAFILYHLAKNPEKQQILRDELMKHLPNKNSKITKEILHNSPYLKAVVKETLRIDPVTVGTTRTTVKNLILSGYQIPKGTNILIMNYLISQDEKNYIKPKEFIPERWLRKNLDEFSTKTVSPFVTLPFGFGPRACAGQRFANLELEVGVAKVIRNFKISWHYPDKTNEYTITRHIAEPLKFQMEELPE